MIEMKNFISLFLVFSISLLLFSCAAINQPIKERKSADIIIDKIDGGKVEGELIAAKKRMPFC
jgi:hypothetical protein